jgi:ATP-dependent RNA helicase DHX33
MLLREAVTDPLLSSYNIVIVDEVHERAVHTDLLLAVLRSIQSKRASKSKHPALKPLKIIIMSATMNVDEFSAYFNQAPVFLIDGSRFDVEIFHAQVAQSNYIFSAIQCVVQIHESAPQQHHGILVFMPSQEHVETTIKTLKHLIKQKTISSKMLLLPLYDDLSKKKQTKVFDKSPQGYRKVIVATSLAETSLTIRDIKYVVDTGMVTRRLFTAENSSTDEPMCKVERISKSQAWQRSGRAGRETAGVCYRLYTEAEFESMADTSVPEILHSNLLSGLLFLISLGNDDLANFQFLTKPSSELLNANICELEKLGAIRKLLLPNGHGISVGDEGENGEPAAKRIRCQERLTYELTSVGQFMLKFHIDPKLSKCILLSDKYKCVEDVLPIVSVLAAGNVFRTVSNPLSASRLKEIECAQNKFSSAGAGQHVTFLNVFKAFIENKKSKVNIEKRFFNNIDIKKITSPILSQGMVPW